MRAMLICVMLLLSGCATLTPWTAIRKSEYKEKRSGFEARVPLGWMRCNLAKYFLITRDGLALNQIAVEKHRMDKKLEYTKKKFEGGMSLQELSEVEADNLRSNSQIKEFELYRDMPEKVSGKDAFYLEYGYTTIDGLKIKGKRYGFLLDKWVYRIFYEAAAQHYYDVYLRDFNDFMHSFRILQSNE